MGFISDLIGTALNNFRIGLTGVNLKNSSGALHVRNAGDTEHAAAQAASIGLKYPGEANILTLQPGDMSGNITFTLPVAVGGAGDVLTDDGTGVLSFAPATAGGMIIKKVAFNQATSSPLSIMTPTANATISKIVVDVESAAGAGTPTIAVGISGTTGKYMSTAQNNLNEQLTYETNPSFEEDGTPDPIIATIVPDGQTFSGFVYVYSGTPV